MGLNTGATDGRIGPRTQLMVRAYQLAVGQPSTGELTTTLLDSLRRTPPPAAARAKSLFTLAAEARSAGRSSDAARLYEAGLNLAPTDPDGLLALGDLRRDRRDFDGARQAYSRSSAGKAGRQALPASGSPACQISGRLQTILPLKVPRIHLREAATASPRLRSLGHHRVPRRECHSMASIADRSR